MLKTLIIGNQARDYAIGLKIKKDNPKTELYFSEGNAGTAQLGDNLNFDSIEDFTEFAETHQIDLTFVNSSKYLSQGIVDAFQHKKLAIIGPHKEAAKLETSKIYARDFMHKNIINTLKYEAFNNYTDAQNYLKGHTYPLVIKTDGWNPGAGVIFCYTQGEAEQTLDDILNKCKLGKSGERVLIEEYIKGTEVSITAIINKQGIFPFIASQNFTRIRNGNTGLNTEGIGTIAPHPYFTKKLWQLFMHEILEPTFNGLKKQDNLYTGLISFNLIFQQETLYLLEYITHPQDPETQALLPLLKNNWIDTFIKAFNQEKIILDWENKNAVCVVLCSGGYPLYYDIGMQISGLDKINCPYYLGGVKEFAGKYYTDGGRVMDVVGIANTLETAKKIAYENVKKVLFDYEYYRTDIGDISS